MKMESRFIRWQVISTFHGLRTALSLQFVRVSFAIEPWFRAVREIDSKIGRRVQNVSSFQNRNTGQL
jgi:hypothetical protein